MLRSTDLRPSASIAPPVAAIGPPVVDEHTGRVFALVRSPQPDVQGGPTGPGALVVLDAATGAVRNVVPLSDTGGGGPNFGIAVDTRLHRLVVLTDNYVTTLDAAHL